MSVSGKKNAETDTGDQCCQHLENKNLTRRINKALKRLSVEFTHPKMQIPHELTIKSFHSRQWRRIFRMIACFAKGTGINTPLSNLGWLSQAFQAHSRARGFSIFICREMWKIMSHVEHICIFYGTAELCNVSCRHFPCVICFDSSNPISNLPLGPVYILPSLPYHFNVPIHVSKLSLSQHNGLYIKDSFGCLTN